MSSTTKQTFYAIAALVGLSVTWYFNLQAMETDPNFSLLTFISDNYVNPSSASITNDIAVVCAVFFFWCYCESTRLGMKYWWAYIPLALLVAIAVAYPLFLLVRERKLQQLLKNAEPAT